jgi:hypothetical protein
MNDNDDARFNYRRLPLAVGVTALLAYKNGSYPSANRRERPVWAWVGLRIGLAALAAGGSSILGGVVRFLRTVAPPLGHAQALCLQGRGAASAVSCPLALSLQERSFRAMNALEPQANQTPEVR